ncbi:MAG: RecX family transcriptional regulator [Bacteroidales bacterium]|nr:RecX family transcriptional regulator [Bacteroidales bacterium]
MILNRALTLEKAIQRAQFLCARQERCSYDIMVKLQQWQIPTKDIEKIIANLLENNFINNERYANMFARDKSRFNKWGPIKIAQALRAKRIPEIIIKESIGGLELKEDDCALIYILNKKASSIKAKSPSDLKAKLIRFGVSRGFEYGRVIEIINKYYGEIFE